MLCSRHFGGSIQSIIDGVAGYDAQSTWIAKKEIYVTSTYVTETVLPLFKLSEWIVLLVVGSSAWAELFMSPENREQEIANLLSYVHYNLDNCSTVLVLGL